MLQYRETFYKQYYTSQLGRNETNYKAKLEEEGWQLAQEIIPLLPQNKAASIVDLGCGIGSLVQVCIAAGYTNSAGVDISEEMVKVAHELGITKVSQQDVNEFLSNRKGSFDVITGIDIIEHFTKDELVNLLSLVRDALKPGGIAIFRTPNMDAPYATIFANGDFTHENFMNASSAKQVMMNCGFTEVNVMASFIGFRNPMKELIRKIIWNLFVFRTSLQLFGSGRSSKVILTPNMVIKVTKPR